VTAYGAQDLARHELTEGEVLQFWDAGRPMTVAELVAGTCLVGYGGHYHELLEDEELVLDGLADQLGPLYGITPHECLAMLQEVREEWIRRLLAAHLDAGMFWKLQGFYVRPKQSPDECPTCGKRIKDFDELGCEAPDGQRWCVEHALEKLSELRQKETT
jgi:hypothetical protein